MSGFLGMFVGGASVPSAPTIGTATAGNGQATITFTAPSSDGGSPILDYLVTSSPGGVTATGSGSPITITGLSNGTAYTFTVQARNVNGYSISSQSSNQVTPVVPPIVATGGQSIYDGTGAFAGYRFHVFTSPGTFSVTSNAGGKPFAAVIVGGGGASQTQTAYGGGGGGGGGVANVPDIGALASGTSHDVVVGAGGYGGIQNDYSYSSIPQGTVAAQPSEFRVSGGTTYGASGGGTAPMDQPGWAPGSGGQADGAWSGNGYGGSPTTRGEGGQVARGTSGQTKGAAGGGADSNPAAVPANSGPPGYTWSGFTGGPGANGKYCPVDGGTYGGGGGGSASPVAVPSAAGSGGAGGGSPGGPINGNSDILSAPNYAGANTYGGGAGGGEYVNPALLTATPPANRRHERRRNNGGSGRVVIRYPYP
jgi:hypothetical protein